MKKLTIDLPTEVIDAYGGDNGARTALIELAVLDLVRRRDVATTTGAQLLKLPLPDFLRLMARHGLPQTTKSKRTQSDAA